MKVVGKILRNRIAKFEIFCVNCVIIVTQIFQMDLFLKLMHCRWIWLLDEMIT